MTGKIKKKNSIACDKLKTFFLRGFGVYALILMSNGDFTPIFFNFVNLPLRFQNEAKIYPYSVYLS